MRSKKTLITIVLACLFLSSCGWIRAPSAGAETQWIEYRGWGPMANLDTPYSPNESDSSRYDEQMRARAQHLAEVQQARDRVWDANAPLRAQLSR